MNPVEAEAARISGWFGAHLPGHQTTAAQAAATTKGTTMNLATFISDAEVHGKALLQKLGQVDHAALAAIEAIEAHPETGTLVSDVAALIGINLPPGILGGALAPVKALLQAYGPQIEQARQAAAEAAAAQQQSA